MHTIEVASLLSELNRYQSQILAMQSMNPAERRGAGSSILAELRMLQSLLARSEQHRTSTEATPAAGPCDAIDAAVTAQQATVDQKANELLIEQLALMILQMQQMICHMMNP